MTGVQVVAYSIPFNILTNISTKPSKHTNNVHIPAVIVKPNCQFTNKKNLHIPLMSQYMCNRVHIPSSKLLIYKTAQHIHTVEIDVHI